MLSFFDEWLERVDRVSYDRDEIETFRSDLIQAATDTRQVQEFVHESQECLRLGIDCVEQFDGCGILVGFAQQVNRVCDRRQSVTQFMSQNGDELILPLAAGDEPRGLVRAHRDVLDHKQQLFGPVSLPGILLAVSDMTRRPCGRSSRVASQSSSGWPLARSPRNLWSRSGMFHLPLPTS